MSEGAGDGKRAQMIGGPILGRADDGEPQSLTVIQSVIVANAMIGFQDVALVPVLLIILNGDPGSAGDGHNHLKRRKLTNTAPRISEKIHTRVYMQFAVMKIAFELKDITHLKRIFQFQAWLEGGVNFAQAPEKTQPGSGLALTGAQRSLALSHITAFPALVIA